MKSYRSYPARKAVLLAGASLIALAVATADLHAADLTPMVTKAPPAAVVQDQWTWWGEGGFTFRPGGDPLVGLIVPLTGLTPGEGWEAAIGFDYRLAYWSPYHISGQFRYGQNNGGSTNFSGGPYALTLFRIFGTPTPASVNANGTANIKEDHWLVDFAIGRDFALGTGNAQAKLGIRIAEINSETTANAALTGCLDSPAGNFPFCTTVTGNSSFQSRSQFLGVGPRLGIDGSQPLGGSWAFDYLGGVAVLFGDRSFSATQTLTATSTGFASVRAITSLSSSNFAAVFNLDAQAGISYWFTPTFKLTGSFRFDGYWAALPILEAGGNIGNQNRFYYGPMLRATVMFP